MIQRPHLLSTRISLMSRHWRIPDQKMLHKGLSSGLVFTISEYRGLGWGDFLFGARVRAYFDTYILVYVGIMHISTQAGLHAILQISLVRLRWNDLHLLISQSRSPFFCLFISKFLCKYRWDLYAQSLELWLLPSQSCPRVNTLSQFKAQCYASIRMWFFPFLVTG